MNKDVIYIDVEDDITAIIGKVKASSEKIVALVPPKRVGVLQSAVNLRLLNRAAEHAGKRLVLITNNHALVALSAAASIPVAKNLQSKPEIAEIPALDVDDGDDIIDGSSLPVGELEKTGSGAIAASTGVDTLVDEINLESPARESATSPRKEAAKSAGRASAKGAKKVPNFNTFRKKIFIGIAAGILLVGGLVWAFVFAPAATVIITARTTAASINSVAQLSSSSTDAKNGIIKATTKTVKKDASVEFDATGQEDRGEKASGRVSLSIRCSDVDDENPTIPAGTGVSSGGKTFITQAMVTLNTLATSPCRFVGSVDVAAQSNGSDYNLPNGAAYSVAGFGAVTGSGSAMTGGVTKIVKVVTAADVQTASEKLVEQSSDGVKQELTAAFGDSYKIISDSFTIDRADAVATPTVGAEATAKATLTSQTTYTMTAIDKDTLKSYLDALLVLQLSGQSDQRVYDTGSNAVVLSGYRRDGDTATAKIVTTGQVGPKIDESAIKEQVKGKRYGDVQASLESIDGVSDVDVRFSFFWVRTIPNNTDKITIEFKLQDD